MTDELGKDPAKYNAGVQEPPDVPGKKLGKLDAKVLKGLPVLAQITSQLAPPPLNCKYSSGLLRLGPMANNVTSDCTCAAIGHTIEIWTSVTSTETVLSDDAILNLYSNACGYVRGDANTDNGGVASDVLLYWYKNPVVGHALAGFASVRPGNRTSIREAIYRFGVCYLGVQLPLAAQRQDSWILQKGQELTGDWEVGSWGGHAVPACDYDSDTLTVVSWGKLIKVGWDWLDAYMDEGYALLSRDWLRATGNSPPGLNLAQLQDDMNSLRGSP